MDTRTKGQRNKRKRGQIDKMTKGQRNKRTKLHKYKTYKEQKFKRTNHFTAKIPLNMSREGQENE